MRAPGRATGALAKCGSLFSPSHPWVMQQQEILLCLGQVTFFMCFVWCRVSGSGTEEIEITSNEVTEIRFN